ncbi:hypothetical protein GobsT_37750 [Gemmata obscuriglobus]|uniref:Uncharacterized protein n=1 Tax=Gemmata obscuriglobus TaxID=114 RepID=A0A2Z3H1C4_9BACT|nr:hypothetical protein [Gemmata obscuriglobus]AWM38132.1 hypothetical protein C1280_14770 [Gemmata obscuriglobus]QEG28986.1 hypothetical protein GobsT_37750 [Gemmata obscuriglobus]VTS07547.1 unnamed protein product [Gemmata obscuriglobus UQM 2246]
MVTRGGQPLRRPRGSHPPCGKCPKVPAGTERPSPAEAVELTDQHRRTVRFYRECRAVGRFPDDPLVRWAAAVIRSAEDHCERVSSQRTQLAVLSALRGDT